MTFKKLLLFFLFCLLSFISSTTVMYAVTKYLTSTPENIADLTPTLSSPTPSTPTIDSSAHCPLNGSKYQLSDQLRWEQRRPVAVMIENHPDSRPQSGLSSADVVYEAVAEGGITRFMALFLCEPTPQWVGPVRSARTYFLDWVSEYNSLYAHVGGANTPGPADALGQIQLYGIKGIDEINHGIQAGFQRIYDRIGPVAREHTMYLDIEKFRSYAQNSYGWGVSSDGARWDTIFEKWTSYDSPQQYFPGQNTQTINYDFWPQAMSGFNITWYYRPQSNTYLRYMAQDPHIDFNSKQPISSSNVVLHIIPERRADDGYPGNQHLLYDTISTGPALIFQNGLKIDATWNKSSRTARTKYLDAQGQEIPFVRGKIWISTIPDYSADTITFDESSLSADNE